MCGFSALFQPGTQYPGALLDGMEADLHHRGPDSGAAVAEPGFALVFRRLAIIDPNHASDQPMTDPSGRFTIVFNGEIYNYRSLRRELEAEGVVFRTAGDTEVLLQGFICWGEGVFARLEGMFATVIVDRVGKRAVAARDPLGIKPLYCLTQGNQTALASEIRPLRRLLGAARPDQAALGELLTFRFAGGNRSNIQGVEKVPGGTLLRISLTTGQTEQHRYLEVLDTLRPNERMAEDEALELAEDALVRSVRQHLESDVGYTLQLSGGVDSSLISALAARESGRRLASFAVSLGDSPLDEGPWRAQVIERYGLEHHDVVMSEYDFADALPMAVAAMEGPSPHFGCVMLMLLCRVIRQHGKVVLTGEGADEMFGGYHRYEIWRSLRRNKALASLVPNWAWPALRRYDGIRRYVGRDSAIYASCYHDVDAMAALFPDLVPNQGPRGGAAARDFRSRMLASDQTVYLESLLMRQDKMAMASSVEARVPFAHLPLAKVVNTIPHRLRLPGGQTKPLLKRIAEKYLPHDVIHRRKVGLTLPLMDWLANPKGLGRYLELLDASDCRLGQFGDHKGIRAAVTHFRAGNRTHLPSLPLLINVELWLRSLDAQ